MNIIMVHGGADTSSAPQFCEVLREASLAGHRALVAGLLDAAEEAVKILEGSPLFNAGYGSVLNRDGEVEMDASIMEGTTGKFGAVAAIRSVSHPVSVARLVLEETPHVLLAGRGATEFARTRGFPPVDSRSSRMVEAWQRARDRAKQGLSPETSLFTGLPPDSSSPCDTVGCVVFHAGRVAAASSTGGSFMKAPGRVGDTPIPGAGIYASSSCAAACTGLGEAFIETLTAKYVDSLVELGIHPQEAAEKAIIRLAEKRGGAVGGIIVVDSRGRFGAAHNSRSFPVALVADGKLDESFIPRKIN
ncbi:MAG: isoaspartyl peptidase/L-asparaginase family protein [Actinobacteria bacterium]|nr:isoaspartyl peptidase/L-asparaginase family protein [Actinomycetota bacterium]